VIRLFALFFHVLDSGVVDGLADRGYPFVVDRGELVLEGLHLGGGEIREDHALGFGFREGIHSRDTVLALQKIDGFCAIGIGTGLRLFVNFRFDGRFLNGFMDIGGEELSYTFVHAEK